MYKGKSVAVVVPAFNEETQIAKVVEPMPDIVDRIIVIDDCSSDRTAEVLAQLQRSHSRLVVLSHSTNEGVGGSIATGYEWVRDHDLDVAVVMAGDAQMDPRDLAAILDPVVDGLADYSKGNRLTTGEAYQKIPKVRYFGNAVLSLLTKIASGYWHVADSQSGYTAVNRSVLETIDWDSMFKRYGQPNDLLVRLNVNNFRVLDVPVEPVYNVGEKSGIRIPAAIFTIGWLLIRLFFWRMKEKYLIRDFHPLVFFYTFGLFLLLASLVLTVRLFTLWFINGSVPELTLLSWLFSITLSFNALFFAMWFDYEDNRHLNPASSRIRRGGRSTEEPQDQTAV